MKRLRFVIFLLIIIGGGYFIGKQFVQRTPDESDEVQEEIEEEDPTGDPNEEAEEEEEDYDFSDFSAETQILGEEIEDVEYALVEIKEEGMNGFHRFTFELESEEEDLPVVEASLNSAGGYVSLVMNNVTDDQSGIDYNSYLEINEEGITRLYHAVTANESEEVYNTGISQDTVFYLHNDELTIILDVKYPGEADEEEYDDPGDFGTDDIELGGTNTEGDAKIVGYSWGVENGAVKFIWETSAVSGNPTPQTAVVYDEEVNTITVTFTDLASDSILASTGSFEMEMSRAVDQVTGSVDGDNHVFVFSLNTDVEYKIYRETSPNQVVIEIR